MKAVLIHNPRGGRNRRSQSRVPVLAREAGIPTWEITGPDELAAVWPDIGRTQPDLLIVNGGDGTVDAVVTALRQTPHFPQEPLLALLAGGTTNMIARDVGLAGNPERALPRLLQAMATGTPGERILRSPLIVRGTASKTDLLGFFMGGGAMPRLLKKIQGRVHHRGFIGRTGEALAMMQTTLRLFFGDARQDPVLAPRVLHWTVDQAPEENEPVVLYFITTLNRLVLGINPSRPAPSLRLLALRHPYHHIVDSVGRLLRRKPFEAVGGDFAFREGRTLRLRFEDEVILDGEPVPLAGSPTVLEIELAQPLTFWRI